jgi:large subunit ribosomal protein L9
MKVILLQDVEKLGAPHEVVEVADGYARNYLVPRSMAIVATPSAMSQLDNMKRVDDRRQNRLRGAAQEKAALIEGKTLVMPARIGTSGRLFGSVGPSDIAAQIQEQLKVEVDRKLIHLPEAIREVGIYQVPVVLHRDVKVLITLHVGDVSAALAAQAAQDSADAAPAEAVETAAAQTAAA